MAFEVIFSAVKDLLKYQIINYTNTGDKTLDSLLNGIMLAVLTAAFAVSTWSNLMLTFKRRCRKNANINLDKDLIEYYKKYIKDHEDEFTIIRLRITTIELDKIINNLYLYILLNIKKSSIIDNAPFYDPIKKEISNDAGSSMFRSARSCLSDILTAGVYEPVYTSDKGVVAVSKDITSSIYFIYNTKEALDEFIKEAEKNMSKNEIQPTEESKQTQQPLQIRELSGRSLTPVGEIYTDRTMDMFISRYKGDILQLMENFKESNEKNVSLFGGYGTYNLGIIMQGDPGTGKTSFIKAVCNYFKRDAFIVNMRNIKTRDDFVSIFREYKTYIYVLDEFDGVSGTIKDRSKIDYEGEERKESDKRKELQEKRLKVLSLMAEGSSKCDTDSGKSTHMSKELESINEEMKELENALTLDTMLTTLDGMVEMRGRIMLASTNHIERIDPALLREGRFDYKFHLTKFNSDEICELLCKMFPDDVEVIKSHKYKEDKYTTVQIISIVSMKRNIVKVIDLLAVS